MNGIDYGSKLNRQREIYQKNVSDTNRNHAEEIENLKKSHEYREKKQVESHSDQVRKLEESHTKSAKRIQEKQTAALLDKSKRYDKAINQQKNDFHEMRTENIRNWDKKIADLKKDFSSNLANTKESDAKVREQLANNYTKNVKHIRETAHDDLESYLTNSERERKNANRTSRIEKNQIISNHREEKNQMLKDQIEKRNFLQENAVQDTQAGRDLATKRFIDSKNLQEKNFKDMNEKVNARIDDEIIVREGNAREKSVENNKKQNLEFKKRFDKLSKQYNKDLRNIEYRKRAEAISQGEINKEIQDKYKESARAQIDLQKETQMRERQDVEQVYAKRLDETVGSYQNTLRERNIAAGERIAHNEARLAEINRRDRFEDRKTRERMSHDHNVALKYVEDKNAAREADSKANTSRQVRTLKENFNRSLTEAKDQSERNFKITKEAMLEDKRTLEKRLHNQNSKENAYIKQVYGEKMEKMASGYESKIKALELENATIAQKSRDGIRDLVRKTNFEIERQNKAAAESAKTQVKTERELAQEKENALKTKIKNLERNFADKMNKQTLASRKKLKDVEFQHSQKMNEERNKYQDIMDQNSKFMAREFQRLKIASDSERQRLITQYEDRISKLQRVYRERANELEQYNQLNKES